MKIIPYLSLEKIGPGASLIIDEASLTKDVNKDVYILNWVEGSIWKRLMLFWILFHIRGSWYDKIEFVTHMSFYNKLVHNFFFKVDWVLLFQVHKKLPRNFSKQIHFSSSESDENCARKKEIVKIQSTWKIPFSYETEYSSRSWSFL